MARSRPDRFGIGFTLVWLTFWTAGIFVAVWHLGGAVLDGDPAAAVTLAVWLLAAGFALASVARSLVRRLLGRRRPRPPHPRHSWNDGLGPPPE
jgi:hypothetical protein